MKARQTQNRRSQKDAESSLLTTGDVAKIFNVNATTVRRWCRQGKIRACGTGAKGHRLFRRGDVAAAYLERSIRRCLKSL